MKNEREKLIFFWLSFCRLFSAWKIVGMINLSSLCQISVIFILLM